MNDKTRSNVVSTRFTDREKALVVAAATEEGVPVAELVSRLVNNGVREMLTQHLTGRDHGR